MLDEEKMIRYTNEMLSGISECSDKFGAEGLDTQSALGHLFLCSIIALGAKTADDCNRALAILRRHFDRMMKRRKENAGS